MSTFAIGSLVTARGREWVVLPDSEPDFLMVRPLGGTDEEVTGIHLALERVEPATLAAPNPADPGDYRSARLLRDAVRLGFRASAGPFRSFGRIACEPRPYQLVPLLLALRLDPVRLLVADDVGIGKTVEACVIARELLDRGEVRRLAVLCPPHLAEQWQRELEEKFSIEAELVLPSTARRLEAPCRLDESLFDIHPFVVVSTDYIKSDRRRDDFLRACPELVIVDEAHTCAAPIDQRGARHQRHSLLKGLATDPDRHLILVTATPHSGNEEAFRSLLALLDPEFATFPMDLSGVQNERHRRRLAAQFVQRRRVDIEHYLDADTPFPEREEKEDSYKLHPHYRALLDRAITYARGLVRERDGGEVRQRVRWWSALALLRSLASSPAAAAATLRSRASGLEGETVQEIDNIARHTILDAVDEETAEAGDVAPGSDTVPEDSADTSERRELLAMAAEADRLFGAKDNKLRKAISIVKVLVRDGFQPIVFCRFIPTAEYVASALRAELPRGTAVAAVTGLLPPDDREARVQELAKAERRVLVCTDCLSEGINLQDSFDAVLHYDLSWNPTRHEQREGRVDRYGQASQTVRVVTYYGTDNQIDGIVLEVLLKKHKTIRSSLGISVPVPVDTEKVMTALLHGALLRGDGNQLALDFASHDRETLEAEWEKAADREKRSRTLFAHQTLDPAEVAAELQAVRRSIGSSVDVERFLLEVLAQHGAQIEEERSRNGATAIYLDETPHAVRDAMGANGGGGPLKVRFSLPIKEGVLYLHRRQPAVQGLAGYVLDSALDERMVVRAVARRCGAVRSRVVAERTILLLLRERFRIEAGRPNHTQELLAEDWQLVGYRGTTSAPEWLSQDEAEGLLDAKPDANVAPDVARTHLERIIQTLPALDTELARIAGERAAEIREAHRRVRKAARLAGTRLIVEPKLPVDVLGVYVYLPVA
ncbi:MAG: DEAD/DEAH box helicase [Acidobacteriia bacterium]|nr:DEAD/DEAH box helicase [Terriglobia bacterium]